MVDNAVATNPNPGGISKNPKLMKNLENGGGASVDPARKPAFVLIVDDEAEFGMFQKTLLEEEGLTAAVAISGEEAAGIGSALSEPGAIALVDMTMPGLDGIETIHALQQRHPALKFIATSGHSESRFRVRLDALGVRTFLPKPYTTDRLLSVIRKLLLQEPEPVPVGA